ncbi:MAG TPA: VOC family protein [Bryobacteraceae bacterium]|nr:VOC family protein [Bryobacteraceae bacterium]
MTTLPLLLALAAGVALAQAPQLRVSMISVGVKDMARSVQFYSETLGLPLVGKPGVVTLIKAGDLSIALNEPLGRAAGDAVVGAVEIIFPAESVAALHENLTERGCSFIAGPHEVSPGLWAATFTDPDGHKLTLLGPR